VTPAPEQVSDIVSDTVAAITGRLAARHDGLTILHSVTQACRSLLAADATGVLIADPRGGIEIIAASDERARFAELLQAQTEEGPCVDCITGNTLVVSADLEHDRERWSRFVPSAMEAGFRSLYAFPLRLINRAVGGVNLLYTSHTELTDAEVRLGQALADLAVLGLTQERDQRRVDRLAEQTLTALNDRVHVSQAVGVIAGLLDVSSDAARARLTAHSTHSGRSLSELARAVTDGSFDPRVLAAEDAAPETG
jgi:transcriptional regulator with GAF, ATPase, and Fis domain